MICLWAIKIITSKMCDVKEDDRELIIKYKDKIASAKYAEVTTDNQTHYIKHINITTTIKRKKTKKERNGSFVLKNNKNDYANNIMTIKEKKIVDDDFTTFEHKILITSNDRNYVVNENINKESLGKNLIKYAKECECWNFAMYIIYKMGWDRV